MTIQQGNPLRVRCDFCREMKVLFERDRQPVSEYYGGDYRGKITSGHQFQIILPQGSCDAHDDFEKFCKIDQIARYWLEDESIQQAGVGHHSFFELLNYCNMEICTDCYRISGVKELYNKFSMALQSAALGSLNKKGVLKIISKIKRIRKRLLR